MSGFLDVANWVSFLSLSALEIVLGIDNVVFLALVVQHLPREQRKNARLIGLAFAFSLRVALLFSVVWIIGLEEPIFALGAHSFSGHDLMMLGGGGFLIYKAWMGIREELSTPEEKSQIDFKGSFLITVVQIIFIDLIFSFDSVITAVGLTTQVPIIVAAMAVAIVIMLLSANFVSGFIDRNPTIKMLAMAFILLVGLYLTAEGIALHINKNYLYFGMVFSLIVELLNLVARNRRRKHSPASSHFI